MTTTTITTSSEFQTPCLKMSVIISKIPCRAELVTVSMNDIPGTLRQSLRAIQSSTRNEYRESAASLQRGLRLTSSKAGSEIGRETSCTKLCSQEYGRYCNVAGNRTNVCETKVKLTFAFIEERG